MVSLRQLVSCCVSAAVSAGDVASSIQKAGVESLRTENKALAADAPKDFVTAADKQGQVRIFTILKTEYPDLQIVGEEQEEGDPAGFTAAVDAAFEQWAQRHWEDDTEMNMDDVLLYVDPIDGTSSLVKQKNLHICMVMIGICYKGVPVAGVLHQPFTPDRKTYWGVVGVGSNIEVAPSEEGRLRVTTSNRRVPLTKHRLQNIPYTELITQSGAGWKTLQVIEGHADAYVYPMTGTSKWDSCGPEAILAACGGVLTDIYGKKIDYLDTEHTKNEKGVVATLSAALHDDIIAKIVLTDE
ncbi:Inositol monophosphatase [Carpediemonas membranifera]|uniref:3'(2'),5'-bisphosphate nucleotidase 1 n=1 Tax=Carpediemonas membranifera TaxID=201153 RepID=A0A8J6EBG3_9EUKA|nr:Inositol monophosphatase [Carpediemonas membranifera]|eukprot:KAG9397120.1 Inositol monophosphatase [Carpediemonas membranifera]